MRKNLIQLEKGISSKDVLCYILRRRYAFTLRERERDYCQLLTNYNNAQSQATHTHTEDK